ncbi:MAG TPA: peptidylprolyl isomerase [Terriglobales bacterium]|nr:peptidylprolyl isomerase [Terriglobales bacterium]
MKKFLLFVLILPALMLLAAVCVAGEPTIVEEIVARVNNSIITRQDLNHARDQLISEMKEKGGTATDQEIANREKDLLRDLIDQQLLIQKAGDLGITGDTELIKRLDEIRKSLNLESMEDLERAAQAQGVSYEEFKQNLRNGILTQAVIGREVGSRIQVTPDEIQKYYEQHKAELERPEQVRLSEILIAPVKTDPKQSGQAASDPTPEQLAAAEKKADDLLAELKKGAKFDDLAKKNSDGPTAAQGGDLGYFKRGTLAKELENQTFNMKKGELTDVIRTRQGFIILKVAEHDAAGIPPLKEVEPQVQEALYMERLQPALRAYLTKLREEAYIDIKPSSGYTDTAASPNQTKPVMTAAAAQDLPKDKTKKKKKMGIF